MEINSGSHLPMFNSFIYFIFIEWMKKIWVSCIGVDSDVITITTTAKTIAIYEEILRLLLES